MNFSFTVSVVSRITYRGKRQMTRRFLALAAPFLLAGCGYNRIQTLDEQAASAKQQIEVQLQRRADLVPNLVNTVKGFIDKIAAETGLPVYISEFDLPIADDNRQREVMQGMFTMFWENPNVPGITLWGYIEGSTWVSNSGLMSSSGEMRPAMTWLMDYLDQMQ